MFTYIYCSGFFSLLLFCQSFIIIIITIIIIIIIDTTIIILIVVVYSCLYLGYFLSLHILSLISLLMLQISY